MLDTHVVTFTDFKSPLDSIYIDVARKSGICLWGDTPLWGGSLMTPEWPL